MVITNPGILLQCLGLPDSAMVARDVFLEHFVAETCAQTLVRSNAVYERPFTLTEKQLVPILTATFLRLGWVSDGSRTETSMTRNVFSAMDRLDLQRPALSLTLVDVASIFERVANMGKASGSSGRQPPCPHPLLREAEARILTYLRQKTVNVGPLTKRTSMGSAKRTSSFSGRRVRASASSSGRTPARSPRTSEASVSSAPDTMQTALVPSVSEADSSPQNSLVAMPAIDQGSLALAPLPQLPSDLHHMTASELRRFIFMHQANWMRVADRLVSASATGNSVKSSAATKQAKRRLRYWKGKARKQKVRSDEDMRRLVAKSQMYIQNKRRKKTAVRQRLTTFGGYRLALARNIGHSSCASTLVMLDCDATHVSSLARPLKIIRVFVFRGFKGVVRKGARSNEAKYLHHYIYKAIQA